MITYYKLKKKIKDDTHSNDGIAIILLVCIACAVLLGFHFVFKSPTLTIAGNKQYFLAQQFSEMIFAKIRRHINDPFTESDSCIPEDFEDVVLDLSDDNDSNKTEITADQNTHKSTLKKCNKFFAKIKNKGRPFPIHLIDRYEIKITASDPDNLTKTITVATKITIVKMQGLNQTPKFEFNKSYIIKIMSLSQFGITFWGDERTRLKKEEDESKVYIHSPTFISDNKKLDLESLGYEEPDSPGSSNPNIIFRDVVYTRSEKITNINDYIYFKKFFNKGIVTHVHNGNRKDRIKKYIPKKDENEKWSIPTDYKNPYKYNPNFSEHHKDKEYFNNFLGKLITNPDDDSDDDSDKGTCFEGQNDIEHNEPRATYIDTKTTISINLPILKKDNDDVKDHLFCGIIVAEELTVNLQGDEEDPHYAMFGIFALKSLKVTGKGTLHIFNPLTRLSLPTEISAANAHITKNHRAQLNRVPGHHLKHLLKKSSAHFAINLFLPMVGNTDKDTELLDIRSPKEIFIIDSTTLPRKYKKCTKKDGTLITSHFPFTCRDNDTKAQLWDTLEDAQYDPDGPKLYPKLGDPKRKPFYFVEENF